MKVGGKNSTRVYQPSAAVRGKNVIETWLLSPAPFRSVVTSPLSILLAFPRLRLSWSLCIGGWLSISGTGDKFRGRVAGSGGRIAGCRCRLLLLRLRFLRFRHAILPDRLRLDITTAGFLPPPPLTSSGLRTIFLLSLNSSGGICSCSKSGSGGRRWRMLRRIGADSGERCLKVAFLATWHISDICILSCVRVQYTIPSCVRVQYALGRLGYPGGAGWWTWAPCKPA